jgi:cell division protein FtsX
MKTRVTRAVATANVILVTIQLNMITRRKKTEIDRLLVAKGWF